MPNLLDSFLRDIPYVAVAVAVAVGDGTQLSRIEWTSDLLSSQVLPYMESVVLAN